MFKKPLLIAFIFISLVNRIQAQTEYVTPGEKLNQGFEYFDEGNFAKAQNLFREFSVNDSFYARAGYLLYLSHKSLEEWDKALDVANKFSSDLTVEDRDLFFKKAGEAAFHGSLHEKGVKSLKNGLTVFNNHPDLYDYLSKNYIMLGKDSLAYDAVLKGLKISPFHTGLLENLGELNAHHKNYTQASMAYYLALFVTFHERRSNQDFSNLGRTFQLLEKLQSTLSADFDASLFQFNWDGDKDTKEKYEDLKLADKVSNTFEIRNYYKEVDELLDADLALNARYKARSKVNYNFAKQSQLMGDKLNEVSKPRNVGEDYFIYGNILQELIGKVTADKKYLKHFQTSIMAMFNLSYFKKVMKKYTKKYVPINRQLTKIMSEAMYDMPLKYEGKVQKANRRFSAYDFSWFAIGDLINNAETDEVSNRKGYWEYFYRNGELETSGEYVAGEKDGIWDEFNKEGDRIHTYTYDNGKFVQMKDFEINGKLQMVRNVKNFELTDSFNSYYPDGVPKRLIYMPKGIKSNGTIAYYHTNGALMYETDLKNFDLNSYLKQKDKRGNLIYEVDFKDGKEEGEIKDYYRTGELFLKGQYKDGEKEGEWTYFNREGKKTAVFNYSKGEKDGKQTYYFDNGEISSYVNYRDGEKDGESITYQKNGKMELKEKFDDGELEYIECFDKEGKSIYKKNVGSSTTLKTTHTNGTVRATGKMRDGVKSGKWKYYNEYGVLTEESEYSDGKTDGKVTTYYGSGLKYAEYFMKEGDYNGKYINFWPNGKKKSEGYYVDDEKVGEWLRFYPNGKLSSKSYFVEGDLYGFQYSYDVKGKLNSNIYYKDDWSYYRVSFDSMENPIDTLHYVKPVATFYYSLNVLGDTMFTSPLIHNELQGKGTYYPNSIRAYDAYYDNGDIDKTLEIKNDMGVVKAVKEYKLGDIVSFTAYNGHPNKVTYKANYVNDVRSGIEMNYFPNGKVRIETPFKKGDRHGLQKRYAPDGTLALIIKWEDGEMISYGDDENNLMAIEDNTSIKLKHKNGKPKTDITIKNGNFDGEFKIFNSNGTLGVFMNYTNGYLNGTYSLYNENGKIQKRIDYVYGDYNGKYIIYDTRGEKIVEISYLNDERHGWKTYYKNGKQIKSVYYYNDEPLYEK